jgi:hypothetical protein
MLRGDGGGLRKTERRAAACRRGGVAHAGGRAKQLVPGWCAGSLAPVAAAGSGLAAS